MLSSSWVSERASKGEGLRIEKDHVCSYGGAVTIRSEERNGDSGRVTVSRLASGLRVKSTLHDHQRSEKATTFTTIRCVVDSFFTGVTRLKRLIDLFQKALLD